MLHRRFITLLAHNVSYPVPEVQKCRQKSITVNDCTHLREEMMPLNKYAAYTKQTDKSLTWDVCTVIPLFDNTFNICTINKKMKGKEYKIL